MTRDATRPSAPAAAVFDGQPWAPGLFTPPLSPDFPTRGDALLRVVDAAWRSPEGGTFALDDWQRALLRHVLEVYPEGHPRAGQLRHRQVVISLGRQNGKSVLAAILGLYGLLMAGAGAEVIGVASTVEQANIVYKRVKHVIDVHAAFQARFRTSGTRGIVAKDPRLGTSYHVKAGRESSLQGIPIRLCLADELHLWAEESWDAVVLGTAAQENGLVLGITTAGDDKSLLLKRLYEQGRKAAAQEGEYDDRLGFFLWEAPAHMPVTDPAFVLAGNPSVACGRRDLDTALAMVRTMPENQARRYVGNMFVSSESSWLPMSLWFGAPKGRFAPERGCVIAVARSLNWRGATITANRKGADGRVQTQVIASLVNPTLDQLEDLCVGLWRRLKPSAFLMESATLKDLAMRLRERNATVEYLTTAQMLNVCSTAYALLADAKVTHGDDQVAAVQMPKAVTKSSGEGWRISQRDSMGDVDAVLATVVGLYGAETVKPRSSALFVA